MKVLVFTAALIAASLAEAPAPPPSWRPSGRLLLVPARLEAYPPPAEYPQTTVQPEVNTNDTRVAQEAESDESQSASLLDSGEYYVLLPDGRLQMVKYATAALKTSEDEQSNPSQEPKEAQDSQSSQYNNAEESNYYQQQRFQPAAYYIQASQEEQKNSQSAQYNNAQGPYKFQQQKFQPAAYPVFIQPTQQGQISESAQYRNPSSAESNNFQQQTFYQQAQYPAYQQYQQQQKASQNSADSKFQQVKQEPFSNFHIELVQFPLPGSQQFTQTKLQLTEPQSAQSKAEEKKEEKDSDEDVSGFEANVQYRDVKPISAPIYTYNPTPLVRILKK